MRGLSSFGRRLWGAAVKIIGSSGNSVGDRVKVETAAVEVDRGLEVLPVAIAIGALLDRLDLGVQPLTDSVGNPMAEVGQDVRQVAPQETGDLDDRRQAAAGGP